MIADIEALPVFFTGEGTEEAIGNLPGVSDAVIERHEEVAKLAMVSIAAPGLVALTALFSFKRGTAVPVFKVAVLLLSITSGGLMAQTAHLGGQIRHIEIRSVALQNSNGNEGANVSNGGQEQEKDNG